MNKRTRAENIKNIDVSVTKLIAEKLDISLMDGFRKFIASETHKMLEDDDLKMWHLSSLAIFDIWENEVYTGTPQNSLYLRGDESE